MSDALVIIGNLADAAGGGHTRSAITRRIAEALARHVPLGAISLGWVTDDGDHAMVASVRFDGEEHDVVERTEALHDSCAEEALSRGRPVTLVQSDSSRFTDARRAFEQGASSFVVIPLRGSGGPGGFARLELGPDVPPDFLDRTFLVTLGKVLLVALRNTRLIARVASLSRRAHRENQQLRQQLEKMAAPEPFVGQSKVMREVLERIDLVAHHPTTVLLRGESGSGKEVLARRIHKLSDRGSSPFIKVNCGAIPLELVESELFGHEEGAFTGASRQHAGVFERADGGTLLLDEVAELPLSAQVKLLRVLQDGQINRVGAEETLAVDVRVIAATHRDLEQMVEDETFRSDLYYRLNVFPIHIPPLRDRQEDIEGLAEVLLQRVSARLGRPVPRLTADVVARLEGYDWPGNVRELENVLQRAAILSPDDALRLPETVIPQLDHPQPRDGGADPSPIPLNDAIREAIERALRSTSGQIYGEQGAARMLNVKPSTLQSKMKKLGIDRQRFVERGTA